MTRWAHAFWAVTLGCVVLATAEVGAQAVSKAVLRVRQLIGIGGTVEVVGQLQAEPVRTGLVLSIDGGAVYVGQGLRSSPVGNADGGYLEVVGRGVDLEGTPPVTTCSPPGSIAFDHGTVTGVGTICDLTGRPRPFGGADSLPFETSPAGLGNQGPAEEVVFGFTPATLQACVDAMRINAVISTPGTCSGGCGADDVAFITLQQRFHDGGFQELCRLPVDCEGVAFAGSVDAGFYAANCTGSIQTGTPAYLLYSSDGGCAANPFAKGQLVYTLRTCQG